MTEFYKFAGDHPILTFFLAMIVGEVLVEAARGLGKFRFVEKNETKQP